MRRGPGPRGPGHRRRGPGGARCRRLVEPGVWEVQARIERFIEPALLLLLAERERHGYELVEELPDVTGEARRVDMGNLYRLLRSLEREGVVESEWAEGEEGPAKRVYRLTDAGRALLDTWASGLHEANGVVTAFLDRHEKGKEVSE